MSFELYKRFHNCSDKYFDNLSLSVSLYIKHIPIYAVNVFHQKTILSINKNLNLPEHEFLYPKLINISSEKISRYTDLFTVLNGSRSLRSIAYDFKYKDEQHRAFASHGVLVNEIGDILLILTVHKDQFIDFYNEVSNDIIDHSKLKLFVSKELFTDEKYSLLWRKIEKEYYYEAIKNDVIVEILPSFSIEKIVYNDGLDINFPTITEFHNHVNDDIYSSMLTHAQDQQQIRIEEERLEQEREEARRIALEESLRIANERRIQIAIERSRERIIGYSTQITENQYGNFDQEQLELFFNHLLENNEDFNSGFDSAYLDNVNTGQLIVWSEDMNNIRFDYSEYQDYMRDNLNIEIPDYEREEVGFIFEEESVSVQEDAPDDLSF